MADSYMRNTGDGSRKTYDFERDVDNHPISPLGTTEYGSQRWHDTNSEGNGTSVDFHEKASGEDRYYSSEQMSGEEDDDGGCYTAEDASQHAEQKTDPQEESEEYLENYYDTVKNIGFAHGLENVDKDNYYTKYEIYHSAYKTGQEHRKQKLYQKGFDDADYGYKPQSNDPIYLRGHAAGVESSRKQGYNDAYKKGIDPEFPDDEYYMTGFKQGKQAAINRGQKHAKENIERESENKYYLEGYREIEDYNLGDAAGYNFGYSHGIANKGYSWSLPGRSKEYIAGFRKGCDRGYSDGEEQYNQDSQQGESDGYDFCYSYGVINEVCTWRLVGCSEGYIAGFDKGCDKGYNDGLRQYRQDFTRGKKDGFNYGRCIGYQGDEKDDELDYDNVSKGYADGYLEGLDEGYAIGETEYLASYHKVYKKALDYAYNQSLKNRSSDYFSYECCDPGEEDGVMAGLEKGREKGKAEFNREFARGQKQAEITGFTDGLSGKMSPKPNSNFAFIKGFESSYKAAFNKGHEKRYRIWGEYYTKGQNDAKKNMATGESFDDVFWSKLDELQKEAYFAGYEKVCNEELRMAAFERAQDEWDEKFGPEKQEEAAKIGEHDAARRKDKASKYKGYGKGTFLYEIYSEAYDCQLAYQDDNPNMSDFEAYYHCVYVSTN